MDPETFGEVVDILYKEYNPSKRNTDPWEEIVMTILSQNTNDDNRDTAFKRLWEKYRSPEEIVDAETEELKELIAPAGLASSKTKYLKNAAEHIIEERDGKTDWIKEGKTDEVHNELTDIKGIGHKTADVVLMFSADRDLCPVDTHVNRVTKRLGITEGSKRKVREQLLDLKEHTDLNKAHLSLISHGRNICTARSPLCEECVVENLCEKVGVE